ncbi:HAD-like protein [Schizophyllum commune Loenen D]|nr:HAD-like protein [Schizophyllum commune Loenen D]
MGREWTEEELKERKLTAETAPQGRWERTKARYMGILDYFTKPAWTELLPPPHPHPMYHRDYTLIIDLDDLLIKSMWDRQHGYRTAKRPGVDYFLAYLSQFYEIVLFTTQNSYTAEPILENLDRYGMYFTYRLYRESTRSTSGHIVKDLSYLNRDLSKVVVLETEPDYVSLHPENAIILPKWDGSPKDRGLVGLIPFLESLAIYKVPDVRPILQAYAGKDIPIEYAKKEALEKQRHIEEWNKNPKSKPRTNPGLAALFGIAPPPPSTDVPLTYLEQKRREYQQKYLEEKEWLQKNREELEKLREQDRQAMMGEVPQNLWEMMDRMKAGAPPPGQEGQQPSAPSQKTP